jgi:hypothetical protein
VAANSGITDSWKPGLILGGQEIPQDPSIAFLYFSMKTLFIAAGRND